MRIDKVNIYICKIETSGFNYSTWKNSVNYTVVYEIISGKYVGWGEATAKFKGIYYAKFLARRLVGKIISTPELMLDGVFKDNYGYQWFVGLNRPLRQVREGLSFALYDLVGKIEQKNIGELLGRNKVKSSIPCMPVIHVNTPDRMRAIAKSWYDDGYRYFKIKLRGKASEDIEAVEKIKGISNDICIYIVDSNYGYTCKDELIQCGFALSGLEVKYFQNPIKQHLNTYEALSLDMNMNFTCDNTAYWPNIKRVLKYKAAKLTNLHPNCMGGVDYLFKSVDYSRTQGVESIMGSSGWLGIQDKAYQKLAFYLQGAHPTEEIGMNQYFINGRAEYYHCKTSTPEVISNPLEIKCGVIYDNDESGFGIEINRDKLSLMAISSYSYY